MLQKPAPIGSIAAGALLAALGGLMAGPASAQQLYPIRIGSQTPPIFEYVYINYAIEGARR